MTTGETSSWDKSRDFYDNFPEICPICKEKWKHCIDYDNHIDAVDDGIDNSVNLGEGK